MNIKKSILLLFFYLLLELSVVSAKTVKIDWKNREQGEPELPRWLNALYSGDGSLWCDENMKNDLADSKWIINSTEGLGACREEAIAKASYLGYQELARSVSIDIIGTAEINEQNIRNRIEKTAAMSIEPFKLLTFQDFFWYETSDWVYHATVVFTLDKSTYGKIVEKIAQALFKGKVISQSQLNKIKMAFKQND